ncbi:response regulator, partial [Phocaeicola vulgatus]
MSLPNRSTKLKVAFGYILLTALLFISIGYIYQEMKSLSGTGDDEAILSQRRHVTNQIIGQLYQAEVIGQSLSTGQIEQYYRYQRAMKQATTALDSLRTLLTDSIQLARLDTVGMLFMDKERNMRNLLKAIQDGGTDILYKQHIDELIAQQDSLLSLPHVRKKVITHTNSYIIRKKPKSFFKRLGEVFSPGKADSTQVNNVIQEEYTDTLTEAYSPADTVVTMLKNIQSRVTDTQQERMEMVNRRTQSLRLSGLKLSQKVNQLLSTIEEEEQALAQNKHIQEEYIRQSSIRTVAGIAIVAVVLAIFFLVLIWRDITRSNHYRRELEKAKRRAEDLLAAREKLMLTITHDIKAPVGSILGYTDLLERITTEERQRFYLNNMQSSANHLLSLVKSLLDYHRLDAHKMDVNQVSFNPHQLFDTIYISFKPMADSKQLELNYHCNESLNRVYIGDPFRIRQIAENLLSNALKFTKEGGITLRAALENGQLHFSISDTGCGISQEEQQRIFHEFTRLHNAQGQEGFGLGLAITRKLVLLLEGDIKIESEQDKGSCFHVYLPLPEGPSHPDENLSGPGAEHTPASPDATGIRQTDTPREDSEPIHLILIDDDRIQLQLTTAMLERPGVTVTCCHHPEELLNQLKEKRFDVLLTDIQMPAMNGFDLLKAIRTLDTSWVQTLPVIALPARSDMDENYFC